VLKVLRSLATGSTLSTAQSTLAKYLKTWFLLLTKNPERYKDFLGSMPKNVVLGVTIETDSNELYLQHKISQAPLPS
jgi:GTP cyclohydrolase II